MLRAIKIIVELQEAQKARCDLCQSFDS